MEEEIFSIILRARDEASAQTAEVTASMRRMGVELERQTIIAGQSFAQLNAQTTMMEQGIASAAAATTTHAATIGAGLGAAAKNMSSSFAAVEQDLSRFKSAMMDAAIVALPVAIVGGDALKMAGDYQEAILKIKSLTSATPEDMALWSPAMVEMSTSGTKNAKELADAMFFVASTQLHGADALHVLDEAQQASTGGMGKMSDLAQVLGGSLNAYVGQAERAANATKYMDQITQAVVQGHMDPASLAPEIGRIGPTAAGMGVPFADVLAMISTGTHVGLSSSVSTTGTAGILNTLGAPGVSTSKGLNEIGIDPLTMATRIRTEGMPQVLEEIKQQMELVAKGDDNIRARLQKEIFPNQRMGGRYFNLLTNVGGDISQEGTGGDANFFRQIDNSITNDSGGVVAKANATMLEGFNAQMQVLKNNVDAVAIAFGSALIPVLTPFVKDLVPQLVTMLTQFANDSLRVGATIGDMGHAFAAMGAVVGIAIDPLRIVEGLLVTMAAVAFVSVSKGVYELIFDIGKLVLSLGALAVAAVTAMFDMALAAADAAAAWLIAGGPITLIIAGLVLASAGLALAWAHDWGGIREITAGAVTFIGEHIGLVGGVLFPFIALPGLIAEAWMHDWGGIQSIVGNAIAFITDRLAELMDKLASMHLGVPTDWREQWGVAKQAVGDAVQGMTDGVGGFVSAGGDAAAGARQAFDGAVKGITDGAGNAASAVGSKAEQMAAAVAAARAALDHLQDPNAIGATDIKAQYEQIMADFKAHDAIINGTNLPGADLAASAGPNAAAVEKTALERELLDLKKQQLAVEGDMVAPQQHLRDLQKEMKDAAEDQVRLANEQKLLMLESADFEQNAELKRINNQIKQDQDALKFTTDPVVAGGLGATIKTLERQAYDIRSGMIGDDNARVEAEISQARDQLNVKLAQNSINQNIAAVNDALGPAEAKKRAVDDAIKIVEHHQAADKLEGKVDPSAGALALPITPRTTGAPAPEAPPAPPIANWGRDDWYKQSAVVVQNTYQVDLHNPVLTTEQNQDDVLAFLQAGLEAADAAGVPLAASGTEVH